MKPSRIAILLFVTSSLLMSTACAPVLIGSAAVTGVSVAADRRSAGAVANDGVIEAKSAMHLSQTILPPVISPQLPMREMFC